MAAKKKKIPKPLVVGQKVYVMLYKPSFFYIEGILKSKDLTEAIVQFESSEGVNEYKFPSEDVLEICPHNMLFLKQMRTLSEKTNNTLTHLKKFLKRV